MKPNEDTCRVPTIVDPKKTHSDSDVCVVSDHKVQSTTASPCSKKKPKNPEDSPNLSFQEVLSKLDTDKRFTDAAFSQMLSRLLGRSTLFRHNFEHNSVFFGRKICHSGIVTARSTCLCLTVGM